VTTLQASWVTAFRDRDCWRNPRPTRAH